MNDATIMIVDDRANIRQVLCDVLQEEGLTIVTCATAEEALAQMGEALPAILITDLKLPGMSGIDLMRQARQIDAHLPVILITAYGSVSSAVAAIKEGAYDYLTKPIDYDRLRIIVRRALDQNRLLAENASLRKAVEEKYQLAANVIGRSESMVRLFNLVDTVASSNANVLVLGESGTGKELLAKALHYNSLRKHLPFVVVDCSALPEGLLENELFGHEKGAFTGALSLKKGRIELAAGGTLFLDEIGDMGLPLQAKLLRVLQERQFSRVGGSQWVKADFRLVAATNHDLASAVKEGRFRADLYYRLNVIAVKIPPLRERKEDIPVLTDFFLHKYCAKENKPLPVLTPETMECLLKYDWPGNVRELENCIERVVVIGHQRDVTPAQLPEEIGQAPAPGSGPALFKHSFQLAAIEKHAVTCALVQTGWNKSLAAKLLGIDRKALYNRIEKYNLTPPPGDGPPPLDS
jgi:DNA-binding NtrC family response regulator